MAFDFSHIENRILQNMGVTVDMILNKTPPPAIGSYVRLISTNFESRLSNLAAKLPPMRVVNHLHRVGTRWIDKNELINKNPNYIGVVIPKKYKKYFNKTIFSHYSIYRGNKNTVGYYSKDHDQYYIAILRSNLEPVPPLELVAFADEVI